MAYSARVSPVHPLAFVEFSGCVDCSDLFDVLRSLREEGWEASFDVFCEATGVHELMLRPGELEKFVFGLGEDGQAHGTVAIVVQRPLDHSAATLYKALAAQHGFRVEICWTKEGAYAALGLDGVSEAIERELQQ